MTKNDDISLETGMLAYSRSLQITEGVFYGTRLTADGTVTATPIQVLEKGVRGQSSEANAKNAGKSNPQTVEFATVPQGCNGVELRFSVRVLPGALKPHACGNPMVGETYQTLASDYQRAGGFRVLAQLYAWNIANARFAWRNRFQSDKCSVTLAFENEKLVFNPMVLDLHAPNNLNQMAAALTSGNRDGLNRFIEGIDGGLSGLGVFSFSVVWAAEMQPGQEIFPSQEYIRDGNVEKDLSRVYAKLPAFQSGKGEILQASIHSQKIGAAIRHIDVWHGHDSYGAISVNPYGGIQETSDVLRNHSSKKSFYDLRKNASRLLGEVANAQTADALSGDVHFVMANLVRGGVFGASNRKAEANG